MSIRPFFRNSERSEEAETSTKMSSQAAIFL
jgi:hypothetical protein